MKKPIYILAVLVMFLSACKKENQYPSRTVDVSVPTVTLNGDQVIVLNVGDSYTELGAAYSDSVAGDAGEALTSDGVNTSEEGLYILNYIVLNKNGYEGRAVRVVAVTNAPDDVDVSGTYVRAATGAEAVVTKVGRRVFLSSNGGGNGADDPIYFMIKSDGSMILPPQYLSNSGAEATFEEPSYDFGTNTYVYTIKAVGFGTSPRTFEKQ